jgi:hypothetical protein
VHHRLDVRKWARPLRLCLGPLVLVAVTGLLVSGCSPGADYPSLFPAVHDMPPPRADTPLDAVQVQQATEALITERNHLNGEVQGAAQKDSAAAAAPQPAKGKATSQATAGNGAPAAAALTAVSETK